MASCTKEYQDLNTELIKLIDYKNSFGDLNEGYAQREVMIAKNEIEKIRAELDDLKKKANTAKELARKAGAEAAKIAQAEQEKAEAVEAAKVEAAKAEAEAKKKADAAVKTVGVLAVALSLLENPVKAAENLISSAMDNALKSVVQPEEKSKLITELKNITEKLELVNSVKNTFNQLTGCGESVAGEVAKSGSGEDVVVNGGGKVKKSRKNRKSKNTRKNKKSKNSRKNSRKNRKN